MEFAQDFIELPIGDILSEAKSRKSEGWRYVQILAVNNDNSVDVVYSYMKEGKLDNLVVHDVPRGAELPSISELYLESFVCENEIHDLFGISFKDLAIDFHGNFYKLSSKTPMTIISPEQLARREKEAKAAKAKVAKEAASSKTQSVSEGIEAKLEGMDPEKAAKVRAAMEAKAKKAAAAEEGE